MTHFDGLMRATPREHGTDPEVIAALLDEIARAGIEMHSLLIWQNGALITEAYWSPYRADRLHMMHSATKSFTSMAVGLAVAEGKLSLDDRVIDYFPDFRASAADGIEAMRLRHLLTMTSGHGRGISGGAWRKLHSSWAEDFLSQPLDYEPGDVFVYDSACSYMLSAIVQRVVGRTVHEYLKRQVFEPLHMSPEIRWDLSPEGINSGGNGLSCLTSDLLKLGVLHLQEGHWNGCPILDSGWVREATAKQVRDVTLGVLTGEHYLGPGESFGDVLPERREGYGFQWWCGRNGSYYATGLFGQCCIVFPDKNAVIAFTAGMHDDDRRLQTAIQDMLRPALGQMSSDGLTLRLNALELRPAPQTSWPQSPAGWEDRYRVQPNDQGVISITLARDGDEIVFTQKDHRGTHQIRAGLGLRVESVTTMTGARLHHSYEADDGFRVAAWAAWDGMDAEGWIRLTFDWAFVETAFRDTVECYLRDDELRLYRRVNVNSADLSLPALYGCRDAAYAPGRGEAVS